MKDVSAASQWSLMSWLQNNFQPLVRREKALSHCWLCMHAFVCGQWCENRNGDEGVSSDSQALWHYDKIQRGVTQQCVVRWKIESPPPNPPLSLWPWKHMSVMCLKVCSLICDFPFWHGPFQIRHCHCWAGKSTNILSQNINTKCANSKQHKSTYPIIVACDCTIEMGQKSNVQ